MSKKWNKSMHYKHVTYILTLQKKKETVQFNTQKTS